MTTSTGKCFAVLVPQPFSKEIWADMVRTRVAPFLRKAFPERRQIRLLLDGERLLNADCALAAMEQKGICLLDGWPKFSPHLNPQENVWLIAEKALRDAESETGTFEDR